MWFLGAQKLSFSALRNVSSRDVVLGHTTTPLLCGQQWWENNSSPPALLNVLEKKYRPSEKNLYLASFCYYTWKIHVFLCVVTTCLLYFTKINCTVCSTAFKFAKKKPTKQTNTISQLSRIFYCLASSRTLYSLSTLQFMPQLSQNPWNGLAWYVAGSVFWLGNLKGSDVTSIQ